MAIFVIGIVFFLLATAFVALYFISCVFVVKAVRLADWLMLLAWVSLHAMKDCLPHRLFDMKVVD